ncbi:MAG: RNA polymerase sigma factor [FCB group bacterium]|jgi:RNA polymerase sigma-70 factor (ECF subfamily)
MARDAEKYFELILNIYSDLERFSLFLTKSRPLAKELLSEAISRGYTGFQRLKSEQAFLSFMFTIINRTYNEFKSRNKRYNYNEKIEIDDLYSKELSPETLTDIKILYEAMDRLKASERELLIMSELMELPYNEIANILHISVGNVKIKVFRAKNKLKKLLQDEPVEV